MNETNSKGHPHAALMAEFAKDAAGMERPWEAWEVRGAEDWNACQIMPKWAENLEYRRKPRTIRIGEMDVPEPVREALEVGTYYYTPRIFAPNFHGHAMIWRGDAHDVRWLARGVVHLTAEAAAAHGRALVALTETKL